MGLDCLARGLGCRVSGLLLIIIEGLMAIVEAGTHPLRVSQRANASHRRHERFVDAKYEVIAVWDSRRWTAHGYRRRRVCKSWILSAEDLANS